MTTYAIPHSSSTELQAKFDNECLILESPNRCVVLKQANDELVLSVEEQIVPVQHDITRVVSTYADLDDSVTVPLVNHFLSMTYGVNFATAIEEWFAMRHPLIADLIKQNPGLKKPTKLPRRLEKALRLADLKSVAANYWQEENCGPAAARAFGQCLVVDNLIHESKVSWLGLAPQTLRHELIEIDQKIGISSFPVNPECREMFVNLTPRTSVEVVKLMMVDTSMPLVVIAGQQLGYKMSGRDPRRVVADLQEFVRTNGYGRCRDFGEFLTKRGLAGQKVSQIHSRNDLVVAGSVLKNCLNNPSQPYRHGVLSGRYKIFCIGDQWEKGALAFDASTWELIEAKGVRNVLLPPAIMSDLDAAISEWKQQNA